MPSLRYRAILSALAVVLALGAQWSLAQKQPASREPSSVAWKAPAEGKADQYVGAETCAGCHTDQARQFAKTIHAKAGVEGAKFGTGCESCHGRGKAHADAQMEAGGDATKVEAAKKLIFAFHGKPEENAAHCLACHSTSKDQDLYNRSEHKRTGFPAATAMPRTWWKEPARASASSHPSRNRNFSRRRR